MRNPAHSLPSCQLRTALPCKGMARVLLVVVMLLGFGGQILLTAASLPDESPRAAILRLTGLDIAPSPMPAAMRADTHPPSPQGKGTRSVSRLGLTPSPAQTTTRTPVQTAPSAQGPTGSTPTKNQTKRTANRLPTQEAMAEDTPCPDHDTRSTPQGASSHTSPSSTSSKENGQAEPADSHHGMGQISTSGIASVAGHSAAHSSHQGPHHHSHHHGLDCPLCPLLGHIIFALACLSVLLSHKRLTRRIWQDRPPSCAPPEAPYQHPPSRGPPPAILTCIIA